MAGVEFLTPDPDTGDEPPVVDEPAAGRRHRGSDRHGGRGRATIVAAVLAAAVLVAAIVRATTSDDRHAVAKPSSSASSSDTRPEPVIPPPNSATACARVLCEFELVLPRPTLAALKAGFPGVHMVSSTSVVVVDDTHQPYLLTRDAAGTIRTPGGIVQLALHVAQPSSADPSGTIYDGDAHFGRFSFTRRTHGFTVTVAVTGPGRALPSVATVSRVADDSDLLAIA